MSGYISFLFSNLFFLFLLFSNYFRFDRHLLLFCFSFILLVESLCTECFAIQYEFVKYLQNISKLSSQTKDKVYIIIFHVLRFVYIEKELKLLVEVIQRTLCAQVSSNFQRRVKELIWFKYRNTWLLTNFAQERHYLYESPFIA